MRLEDIYNSQIDQLVLEQDRVDVWMDFCRSLAGYQAIFQVSEEGKDVYVTDKVIIDANAFVLGTGDGETMTTDLIAQNLEEDGESILIAVDYEEAEENAQGQAWLNTVKVDCDKKTLTFEIVYEVIE